MDTEGDFKSFKVTTKTGKEITFKPYEHGPGDLYMADYVCDNLGNITFININNSVHTYGHSFITVAEHIQKCSEEDVRQANNTKKLYERLTLSPSAFQRAIKNGEIENTNITKKGVSKKDYIYGKDAANLRARAVRKKPNRIPHIEIFEKPKDLLPKLQNVNIY